MLSAPTLSAWNGESKHLRGISRRLKDRNPSLQEAEAALELLKAGRQETDRASDLLMLSRTHTSDASETLSATGDTVSTPSRGYGHNDEQRHE